MVSALSTVGRRSCSRLLAQIPLAIFVGEGGGGNMERFTDPISRGMNNGKRRKGVKWPAVACDFLKELSRPKVTRWFKYDRD